MVNIETASLTAQSYGLAMAQNRFGGPCGIWLECHACPTSDVITGSRAEEWAQISTADCAKVFRRHGWTGIGDRMTDARCPACSAPFSEPAK